jgi:prevent-host-death family protein
MAEQVGIRELKNQATQILRRVREEGAEYLITLRGEPVAALKPIDSEDDQALLIQRRQAALARSLDLAKLIAESWQDERSGVEILEQMREEESRWPL